MHSQKADIISIPYGAIKRRQRAIWKGLAAMISIPYGAIKS